IYHLIAVMFSTPGKLPSDRGLRECNAFVSKIREKNLIPNEPWSIATCLSQARPSPTTQNPFPGHESFIKKTCNCNTLHPL
ncbi:hypothetical protein, partial [Pseudomonas syringae]|uniref:hypothetical protein n=1 Tax=Pseudomonas syringae TaxID=317 RepID=UPI001E35E64A